MLDEKDLPLDLTPDLTPEDDLITDLPGEIEILESPDIPVVIDKEEEVGVLLEEEIALETLVEADDYSGPHDEFDWTITNRNAVNYSPEETKRLLAEYDSTFNSIHEGQVLQGKVASIVGSDVVFDIRFKSDGLIPLSEFRDLDLKPGDLVEIYVETHRR
jgi:small subunit ribosomal protein S1